MIRSEVLKALVPVISDQLVVCNIGLPSQELHLLDDQPSNFYMLGTMGLASSIGLGLALAQKQKHLYNDIVFGNKNMRVFLFCRFIRLLTHKVHPEFLCSFLDRIGTINTGRLLKGSGFTRHLDFSDAVIVSKWHSIDCSVKYRDI